MQPQPRPLPLRLGLAATALGLGTLGVLRPSFAAPGQDLPGDQPTVRADVPADVPQGTTHVHLNQPTMTLDMLAAAADDVLHVRVDSVQQRGGADLPPHRCAGLTVLESLLGATGPESCVTYAGGAYPGGEWVVPQAPDLLPGQEYLLFVARVPGLEGYSVLGLSQGTYSVREGQVFGTLANGRPLDGFLAQVQESRRAFRAAQSQGEVR